MKVACISGQKRNGKDEAAELFVQNGWEKHAFADAIKDSFCELFGVTREFIEEWKENPEPPPGFLITIREALQFVGDGFRKIKAKVWVEHAFRRAGDKTLFSDGRYINELKACKNAGGINILIYRVGFLNESNHPSEAQIRPYLKFLIKNNVPEGKVDPQVFEGSGLEPLIDYWLINNGTLEEWYKKIEKYLGELL